MPREKKPSPDSKRTKQDDFFVAGIGASAGGLESMKKFFPQFKPETGIAFIVIQHLDPDMASNMAEILNRISPLKAVQAENGMKLEPDKIFIIPPNQILTLVDNVIVLKQVKERFAFGTSIEIFFRSLAESKNEKAIGIILSGAGSHGALGIKDIKGHGGLVVAEDPNTTNFSGMPQAAINSGFTDYIIPADKMANLLLKYTDHYEKVKGGETEFQLDDNNYDAILRIIYIRKHIDFKHYKKSTLQRRIQRRISLNRAENMEEYLKLLKTSDEEVNKLFADFLIGATRFFRDIDSWDAFRNEILPGISQNGENGPIRVWVPGCSTGEEAYTLAMIITDYMEKNSISRELLIFATDIDDEALVKARKGIYAVGIHTDIPGEYFEKYIAHKDSLFQVKSNIRNTVIFSHQNVIADPPFSQIDLISCRNLLIYLEAELQKKVLSIFHFALKQSGYLFLSSSERITNQKDNFEMVSKKWSIYKRIGNSRSQGLFLPVDIPEIGRFTRKTDNWEQQERFDPASIMHTKLLHLFAPASVIIDGDNEILYYYGDTGKYLKQPGGEPTQNLLNMAENGLRFELRSVIEKVKESNKPIPGTKVSVNREGSIRNIFVSVHPVVQRSNKRLMLVSFEDAPEQPNKGLVEKNSGNNSIIKHLKYELVSSRDELQTTIDELQNSNEELKASNEEVMSMNEELQSTNEELETSREELQSINEELLTVNSQHREKVDELNAMTNDLINFQNNISIPILFLDREFKIRRFTPAAKTLFNVLDHDIGRSIKDLKHQFKDENMFLQIERVLKTLMPESQEVVAENGEIYMQRVNPYRTQDDHIEGVVVVYSNITELKEAENVLQRDKDALKKLVIERSRELQQARRLSDIGMLSATVAHELRNPLAAITVSLANIQKKIPSEQSIDKFIEIIKRKIAESDRIINDLLFYSRLRYPEYQKVKIDRFLKETLETFSFNERNVKVTTDIEPVENVVIDADPVQLSEVFSNILKNSCEAFSEVSGNGRIEVSACTKKDDVIVIFADNGPGVDKKILKKLKEPFYTTKIKGTGLGLMISNEIIKMHNGKLILDSEKGKGMTVTVILPVSKKENKI